MNIAVNNSSNKSVHGTPPQLSVVMITFNQERYIAMAIESILKQKTKFDYELIIGEDCSSDDTRNICIRYQKLYPNKIHLTPGDKNLGPIQRFLATISFAKGRYIAICEGDDYWTDPRKLQMQYDVLKKNPSYSGIHTKVYYIDGDDQITGIGDIMPSATDTVGFDYLVQQNVIRTCSFMFRADVLDETVCKMLATSPMPDYTLFLTTALKGDIYYLRDITAAYRNRFGVTANWKFPQTKKMASVHLFFTCEVL